MADERVAEIDVERKQTGGCLLADGIGKRQELALRSHWALGIAEHFGPMLCLGDGWS